MFKNMIICFVFFITCSCFANQINRIVSLGPTVTTQLYILGAGDKVVGNTTYSKKLKGMDNVAKIGSVTDANVEKIASLKPDIVFATDLSNPVQLELLKKLGIKIYIMHNPHTYLAMCREFIKMGEIIGEKNRAEKIVERSNKKVEALRAESSKYPKQKVFVEIGANPLFTITKDSYINDFIKFAGGINVAADASSGIYSRENVVEKAPDAIIIISMGIVGNQEKQIWEKFSTIPAVKNNMIFIMSSDKLCSSNPVSFPETLREIIDIIHRVKVK
ncbi:MAG TPA: helical backbone metal receptor [Victivallales bacterium]|nr:helical backbone metal receptor [Victivallales bacterium]